MSVIHKILQEAKNEQIDGQALIFKNDSSTENFILIVCEDCKKPLGWKKEKENFELKNGLIDANFKIVTEEECKLHRCTSFQHPSNWDRKCQFI